MPRCIFIMAFIWHPMTGPWISPSTHEVECPGSLRGTCHRPSVENTFNGRAHGTLDHDSAHHRKNHDVMACTMVFHGVHQGVAHGAESSTVYSIDRCIPWCNPMPDPNPIPNPRIVKYIARPMECSMEKYSSHGRGYTFCRLRRFFLGG